MGDTSPLTVVAIQSSVSQYLDPIYGVFGRNATDKIPTDGGGLFSFIDEEFDKRLQ